MEPYQLCVALEVFKPDTRDVTIRIRVPAEALGALASNGLGQLFVQDRDLADATGVTSLILAVERIGTSGASPSGLKVGISAHGDPKLEGSVVASAGSAWWENRNASHRYRRARAVEAIATALPSRRFESVEELSKIVVEMLEEAFDAGAGIAR